MHKATAGPTSNAPRAEGDSTVLRWLAKVQGRGLHILLPVLATIIFGVGFAHTSVTLAQRRSTLGQLSTLILQTVSIGIRANSTIEHGQAEIEILENDGEDVERAMADFAWAPLASDEGARREAGLVRNAATALMAEWRLMRTHLERAKTSSIESPARAKLAADSRVHSARLQRAALALTVAASEFEAAALRHDILLLAALTLLLLLSFAGSVWLASARTRQVMEQGREVAELALVAKYAASAVVVADHESRVLYTNAACQQLTGWEWVEATGRPVHELLLGGHSGEGSDVLASALRAGHAFSGEVQLFKRNDVEYWSELELVPVPSADSQRDRLIVTFQDVTQRRSATAALAASESRFRAALDSMSEGLVIQSPDGSIEACNASAEVILGLSADQMAGRTSLDPRWRSEREDGTDFPGDEHPSMATLKTGQPSSGTIMGVHRPDGSHAWISIESNAIWAPGSEKPAGVVTTFLDVTARRSINTELRKLMQMVDQSPLACIITNANHEMEYVNRCLEEVTGWRLEEVLGRNPRMFASGATPAETYRGLRDALSSGQRWQGELWNHRRDGTLYCSRMTAFPLRDAAGTVTHYASLSEDVTEEHLRQQELAMAREDARSAERAKAAFLNNMSHELRTPLNGILGMADLLQHTALDPEQLSDVETLRDSADKLLAIISQLFDFTRAEGTGPSDLSVAFRLRSCLQVAKSQLAVDAEARGLAWQFEIDEDVPDALIGDPGRLREVLLQLTDNALKFTSQGEVSVRVRAEASEGASARVRFEVRDSGEGIAPERQSAIFEAFEQADGSSTRKYGGLGLGLTHARSIVTRLGGRFEVKSELGSGSTFSFTIPLALGGDRVVAPVAPAIGLLRGARILLVDGGGSARTQVVETLEREGATVQVVPGAEAALCVLREGAAAGASPLAAPQVIVLDERGGGLEPFAAARRLRDEMGDVLPPMALIAAAGHRGDASRCHELGVHAYLTPPLGETDLSESLERLLRMPRSPEHEATLITRHVLREARRRVRVLLVEDNPVNRKVATRLLERSGFVVGVAGDGKAGAETFRQGGWDVVLMDMQMPVMDGLESTRAIREWEREQELARTPIVAVTAHALGADRDAAFEAGMDEFVTKPIQADDLLHVIHKLVGDSPTEAAEGSAPPLLQEVMDWDSALARMDGDESVLRELLRLFLQDSENMMQRFEEARISGDVKLIERAAHGLKGASATISARTVAPLARDIENLARDGKMVEALDRMQELRSEMQRLRRGLEALPDVGWRAA